MLKYIRFTVILIVTLISLSSSVLSIEFEKIVNEGNMSFNVQDYDGALEKYQIAEAERPETPELDYNLAGVLYQQGKYEEAVERFTKALNTTDINLESSVSYNLGNTYFKMQDYQKAIESYQSSLERNPENMDAKYNLELARRLLKEQMKPENKDQQEKEQEQQEQQEKEEQEKQQQGEDEQEQQDKKDQEQQQQQQKEANEEEKDNQQPQAEPEEKQMSKEDAERILNALRDDEQDVQKKVKREIKGGNYTGKDW